MNKVTFWIHALVRGGAEKCLCVAANGLAEQGHDVEIVTLEPLNRPGYDLDARIRLSSVDSSLSRKGLIGKVFGVFHLLFRLRSAQGSRQDTVHVSFIDQLNFLLLLSGLGLKRRLVVSERVYSGKSILRDGMIRRYTLGVLADLLYGQADAITIQSEGSRNCFPAGLHHSITVLPNPVETVPTPSSSERELRILMVCRLSQQKRVDLALQAFVTLHERFPDWRLRVIGSGPDRESLEHLAVELDIAGAVDFLPSSENLTEEYTRAAVFLLASDYEGFPNALAEAMAHGCACIATDCPTGPSDLIQHEDNGLLVPMSDSSAIAGALSRLMGNLEVRQRFGEEAREVSTSYSVEKYVARWEQVIAQVQSS